MGDSAGGNIAYQVGLAEVESLLPFTIRGILQQPFFGGVQRSGSELRLVNDSIVPLCVCDLAWELALPIGVDRDHEYCNPTVGGGSKAVVLIGSLGWKVMVTGWDGDPLYDRQVELAKMLEAKGVRVVAHFGHHVVEIIEPCKAKIPFSVIKRTFGS
ncbi:Carboxylesterase 1 [Morus notabilis]|uniref:Carboxylesterase 1 n=1 Tax=Morus notabilis TaxID=981085 RepID=W9SBW7_9ROSA|nr:Carboxylesterase 1 [Morus notabilis]